MKPAGLEAFEKRKESRSAIYSYEKEPAMLPPVFEKKFKANKKAWAFFQSQPAYYKRTAIHLVMAAKQEATRLRRFESLVSDSENELRIKSLRPNTN